MSRPADVRGRLQLSPRGLADLLGVPEVVLLAWESGEEPPPAWASRLLGVLERVRLERLRLPASGATWRDLLRAGRASDAWELLVHGIPPRAAT